MSFQTGIACLLPHYLSAEPKCDIVEGAVQAKLPDILNFLPLMQASKYIANEDVSYLFEVGRILHCSQLFMPSTIIKIQLDFRPQVSDMFSLNTRKATSSIKKFVRHAPVREEFLISLDDIYQLLFGPLYLFLQNPVKTLKAGVALMNEHDIDKDLFQMCHTFTVIYLIHTEHLILA